MVTIMVNACIERISLKKHLYLNHLDARNLYTYLDSYPVQAIRSVVFISSEHSGSASQFPFQLFSWPLKVEPTWRFYFLPSTTDAVDWNASFCRGWRQVQMFVLPSSPHGRIARWLAMKLEGGTHEPSSTRPGGILWRWGRCIGSVTAQAVTSF